MKLSWKQKALVYAPGVVGNIAGLFNCVFAALLIKEQGVTLYTAPVALFIPVFSLFLMVVGGRITLEWKERLEDCW